MCIRHPASFVQPLGNRVSFNILADSYRAFANAMNHDGVLFVYKLSRKGTPQIAQHDEVCMSAPGAEQSNQANAKEGPRQRSVRASKVHHENHQGRLKSLCDCREALKPDAKREGSTKPPFGPCGQISW